MSNRRIPGTYYLFRSRVEYGVPRFSSKGFKVELAPEDINCVGCLKTKGVQFSHCRECDIRRCGLTHKVKNCALCPDYSSCEKINKFIAGAPPAKANLEEVRNARQR